MYNYRVKSAWTALETEANELREKNARLTQALTDEQWLTALENKLKIPTTEKKLLAKEIASRLESSVVIETQKELAIAENKVSKQNSLKTSQPASKEEVGIAVNKLSGNDSGRII